MKNLVTIILAIVLITIVSCGKDNIAPVFDVAAQRVIDIALIDEYLENKGYTDVDTTSSGVRYVVIDEGSGEDIDESDIVTFDYTGHLLSDTVFDTSIKSVVDSIRSAVKADSVGLEDKSEHEIILAIFSENRSTDPLAITYSTSGWPFNETYIQGFTEGIVASFNSKNAENGKKNVKVGGKVLLAIPSDLAYSTDGVGFFVKPNTVILFEIYPTKLQKQ